MDIRVHDIDWDTDGHVGDDKPDLPTEVVLSSEADGIDDPDEQIADKLSDKFGFCVNSFQYETLDAAPAGP